MREERKLSENYVNILKIENLRTYFYTYEGVVKALDGINLEVQKGDFIGVVGETGCGKSVTALSIMRLIERPGKIISGDIYFKDENLLKKSEKEMKRIRGSEISMIFQDARASLNPVFTIKQQISQILHNKEKLRGKKLEERLFEMLNLVSLPNPRDILERYPHELSGGMCQRVMIAMALSCSPSLLIADEPTTALDVTIEAQILNLIKEMKRKIGISMILITHNLNIIAETCSTMAVMYAGHIIERGTVSEIFNHPRHPYTTLLLKSAPKIESKQEKLSVISGSVPDLINPPSGCRFHPRCPQKMDICSQKIPDDVIISTTHIVGCFLYGGI